MTEPVLEAVNLSRTVADGDHAKTIVDNFSFKFHGENIYTIIGPSGAGKSSLLRLLNRLDEPTSGEALYHGKKHVEYTACQLRRKVGYLFQTPFLFEGTVRDNLLYASEDLTESDISRLIDETRIDPDQLDRPVDNLSVGEKQRVAFARLLATRPEVILLDEPTSALDPAHTESIEKLIKEVVACEKLTALVVTHNPEQALRIGGEVLLLVDGRLEESGSAERVIVSPKSEAGKKYKARLLK